MADHKDIPSAPQPVPNIPSAFNADEVKSQYSNNLEMLITGLDARLLWSEVIVEVDGSVRLERKANLVTTIEHLRQVQSLIAKNLAELDRQMATTLTTSKETS